MEYEKAYDIVCEALTETGDLKAIDIDIFVKTLGDKQDNFLAIVHENMRNPYDNDQVNLIAYELLSEIGSEISYPFLHAEFGEFYYELWDEFSLSTIIKTISSIVFNTQYAFDAVSLFHISVASLLSDGYEGQVTQDLLQGIREIQHEIGYIALTHLVSEVKGNEELLCEINMGINIIGKPHIGFYEKFLMNYQIGSNEVTDFLIILALIDLNEDRAIKLIFNHFFDKLKYYLEDFISISNEKWNILGNELIRFIEESRRNIDDN